MKKGDGDNEDIDTIVKKRLTQKSGDVDSLRSCDAVDDYCYVRPTGQGGKAANLSPQQKMRIYRINQQMVTDRISLYRRSVYWAAIGCAASHSLDFERQRVLVI